MESLVKKTAVFYKGKKIFVTGHTGFKGAWLITWLNMMGATVKGYSLTPQNEADLFGIVKPHITFESVIEDIRNKEKLTEEILNFKPDLIFHLAAQALVRRSYEIPSETFEVNVIGTANVLEAVIKLENKCTVVVVTTDKVYENKEIDHHYKEDDILGGYDPYSASKAAAEIVVSSFRNSFFHPAKYAVHKKAIASVRAGNVIGGGDWSADRIIPDIVRSLKQEAYINVRNPVAVRPWQHVLEPLSGYLLTGMLADQDVLKYSGAYNFGPVANDHLPVKDLVEIAIACWGKGKWNDTSDIAQPHEAGLLKLDISKAKNKLNWQPKLGSKEAIQWTIDWYKQTGHLYEYTVNQIKKYEQNDIH